MKKIKLLSIVFFISTLVLSYSIAEAQVSPLFQTPSLGLNLPTFNPAFAGDSDGNRVYLIGTSIRPRKRSLTDNYSSIVGYDGKISAQSSSFLFTYGISINHNQVELDLAEDDMILVNPGQSLSSAIFRYGTAELILGGRLPIGGGNRTKKHKPGKSLNQIAIDNNNIKNDEEKDENLRKHRRRERKKITKRNIQLDPNNAEFLAPLSDSWVCSQNSSLDYLAMNVSMTYNYTSLMNESGLIFGNQVFANQIGAATPFSITPGVSDPTLNGNEVLSNNNFDLGIGVLFHKVLSDKA
ncbi:MAG: hypothetical protein WBA74_21895, partial [Cyclobacteriaceae bacterium]